MKIKIYYRASLNDKSQNRPSWVKNKEELLERCFNTFLDTWKPLDPYIVLIVDGGGWRPSRGYQRMEIIDVPVAMGQARSYDYQVQLALDKGNDDEWVWFQEDDYLWDRKGLDSLVVALHEFDFVSPYDHPEAYEKTDLHNRPIELKVVGDRHWRTNTFNTMSWGTRYKTFRENLDVFQDAGYWDEPTFRALSERNLTLWSPMPSIATHVHKGNIAHLFNWKSAYGYKD